MKEIKDDCDDNKLFQDFELYEFYAVDQEEGPFPTYTKMIG